MSATDRFIVLLLSGGHATQERGWGPIVRGSDGVAYSARTSRRLEREGICRLYWSTERRRWEWHLNRTTARDGTRARA